MKVISEIFNVVLRFQAQVCKTINRFDDITLGLADTPYTCPIPYTYPRPYTYPIPYTYPPIPSVHFWCAEKNLYLIYTYPIPSVHFCCAEKNLYLSSDPSCLSLAFFCCLKNWKLDRGDSREKKQECQSNDKNKKENRKLTCPS